MVWFDIAYLYLGDYITSQKNKSRPPRPYSQSPATINYTSTSSTDEQQKLEERFGPLLSISYHSLANLALNIRKANPTDHFTTAKCTSRLNGPYNLVHIIEFDNGHRFVVRVPAT